jgi:hypothetical protein
MLSGEPSHLIGDTVRLRGSCRVMRGELMKRTTALCLTVLLLAGCGGQQEADKSSAADATATSDGDLAACEAAMREQFEAATLDLEGGDRPQECEGASNQQIEEIATRIIEDAFDTPPAQPDTPEPEPESEIAKVGPDEWFTYEDGVEVQVTKVEPYTLGEYAMVGNPGDPGVIVTVTIKNGTSAVFDATLADVQVTYGPNGDTTEREYDEAGFTGSIPPGRAATAKFDFAVVPTEHHDELLIEVSPSWDHQPSFFQGSAS